MKVLLVNGSRRAKGCTHTALGIVAAELEAAGIDTVEIHVADDDAVDQALTLLADSDGLVLGTPVYWASPTGEMELFMDHLWGKANRELLAGKPCAVLVTARRAGTTSVIDDLAKYPTFAEMPIVSLFYWPMVHGNTPDEVQRDEEGVQIMQQMGANMAWMLKCFEAGRAAGIEVPAAPAKRKRTNFVR